jgi:hypothetical protein
MRHLAGQIWIFSTDGSKVYTNDNYANDWDGKDGNGNYLPCGYLLLCSEARKIKPIKGYIVIKR